MNIFSSNSFSNFIIYIFYNFLLRLANYMVVVMCCKLQVKEREVWKKATHVVSRVRKFSSLKNVCHDVIRSSSHMTRICVYRQLLGICHKKLVGWKTLCKRENKRKTIENYSISLNNSQQWHFGGVVVLFARMRASKMGTVSN